MLTHRSEPLRYRDALIAISISAVAGSVAFAFVGCVTNCKTASDAVLVMSFFFVMSFCTSAVVGLTVGLAYAWAVVKVLNFTKSHWWLLAALMIALPFVIAPWAIYANSYSHVKDVEKSFALSALIYFVSTMGAFIFVIRRQNLRWANALDPSRVS